MNKVIKSILLVSVVGCLASCGGGKEKEAARPKSLGDAKAEFAATLTAADTSAVKTQATRCMELLKADSVEQAIDMLYTVDGTKLRKLSDEEKANMKKRFTRFPVVDYAFEYLAFATQGNNDMKYTTYSRLRAADERPSKGVSLMFNPVRIDGQWYLAIKTAGQGSKEIKTLAGDRAFAPAEVTF